MHTLSRDELIERAYPLVAIEARRIKHLPPGYTVEDLESYGGEVLIAAAAEYGGTEEKWPKYAKFYLRNRMQCHCGQAKAKAARQTSLDIEPPDGQLAPQLDPKASDPAEIAEAREQFALAPRKTASATRLAASLPPAHEVADKVTQLRTAMFEAIRPDAVAAMMQSIQNKAADGDLKAAKVLIDLLAPARSGITTVVNQQAVILREGDI